MAREHPRFNDVPRKASVPMHPITRGASPTTGNGGEALTGCLYRCHVAPANQSSAFASPQDHKVVVWRRAVPSGKEQGNAQRTCLTHPPAFQYHCDKYLGTMAMPRAVPPFRPSSFPAHARYEECCRVRWSVTSRLRNVQFQARNERSP